MEGRDGPAEEAALCGHILLGGLASVPLFTGEPRHSCSRSWEQDTAGRLSPPPHLSCPLSGPLVDLPGALAPGRLLLYRIKFKLNARKHMD
ncbi:unnamed protein product [Boreogadus saida]